MKHNFRNDCMLKAGHIPSRACLKIVAVLEHAHVGTQTIISRRQLGQQLWRQLIEVQRPRRKQEPVDVTLEAGPTPCNAAASHCLRHQACPFYKLARSALATSLMRLICLPHPLPATIRIFCPQSFVPGSPEAHALHSLAVRLIVAGHLCKHSNPSWPC